MDIVNEIAGVFRAVWWLVHDSGVAMYDLLAIIALGFSITGSAVLIFVALHSRSRSNTVLFSASDKFGRG